MNARICVDQTLIKFHTQVCLGNLSDNLLHENTLYPRSKFKH